MKSQTEYQEVPICCEPSNLKAFVLHGSHSSVTIYYAKLPHSYLAEIARHGKNYLHRCATKQRISLRRTKKFHLQHTGERVELYRILAKLLWYLIGGRSHVGYLFNYAENPLHRIVLYLATSRVLMLGTNCT